MIVDEWRPAKLNLMWDGGDGDGGGDGGAGQPADGGSSDGGWTGDGGGTIGGSNASGDGNFGSGQGDGSFASDGQGGSGGTTGDGSWGGGSGVGYGQAGVGAGGFGTGSFDGQDGGGYTGDGGYASPGGGGWGTDGGVGNQGYGFGNFGDGGTSSWGDGNAGVFGGAGGDFGTGYAGGPFSAGFNAGPIGGGFDFGLSGGPAWSGGGFGQYGGFDGGPAGYGLGGYSPGANATSYDFGGGYPGSQSHFGDVFGSTFGGTPAYGGMPGGIGVANYGLGMYGAPNAGTYGWGGPGSYAGSQGHFGDISGALGGMFGPGNAPSAYAGQEGMSPAATVAADFGALGPGNAMANTFGAPAANALEASQRGESLTNPNTLTGQLEPGLNTADIAGLMAAAPFGGFGAALTGGGLAAAFGVPSALGIAGSLAPSNTNIAAPNQSQNQNQNAINVELVPSLPPPTPTTTVDLPTVTAQALAHEAPSSVQTAHEAPPGSAQAAQSGSALGALLGAAAAPNAVTQAEPGPSTLTPAEPGPTAVTPAAPSPSALTPAENAQPTLADYVAPGSSNFAGNEPAGAAPTAPGEAVPATAGEMPSWMEGALAGGVPAGGVPAGGQAANGQSKPATFTAYAPGGGGIEGGNTTSGKDLNGKTTPHTVADYAAGRSSYVTLAGSKGRNGERVTIPSITFNGQTYTNVPGLIHDTGAAFNQNPRNPGRSMPFKGAPRGIPFNPNKLDIAWGTGKGQVAAANRQGTTNGQVIAGWPGATTPGTAFAQGKPSAPAGTAVGAPQLPPAQAAKEAEGDRQDAKTAPPAETQGSRGPAGTVIQNQKGQIRSQAITPDLQNILSKAGAKTGVTVTVHSGGQPSKGTNRTGSHRHDIVPGSIGAADVVLHDAQTGRVLDMNNRADQARMKAFATEAVRNGATGVGAGVNYMGPNTMHIGGGKTASWGGAPWIGGALQAGLRGGGGKAAPGQAPAPAGTAVAAPPLPAAAGALNTPGIPGLPAGGAVGGTPSYVAPGSLNFGPATVGPRSEAPGLLNSILGALNPITPAMAGELSPPGDIAGPPVGRADPALIARGMTPAQARGFQKGITSPMVQGFVNSLTPGQVNAIAAKTGYPAGLIAQMAPSYPGKAMEAILQMNPADMRDFAQSLTPSQLALFGPALQAAAGPPTQAAQGPMQGPANALEASQVAAPPLQGTSAWNFAQPQTAPGLPMTPTAPAPLAPPGWPSTTQNPAEIAYAPWGANPLAGAPPTPWSPDFNAIFGQFPQQAENAPGGKGDFGPLDTFASRFGEWGPPDTFASRFGEWGPQAAAPNQEPGLPPATRSTAGAPGGIQAGNPTVDISQGDARSVGPQAGEEGPRRRLAQGAGMWKPGDVSDPAQLAENLKWYEAMTKIPISKDWLNNGPFSTNIEDRRLEQPYGSLTPYPHPWWENINTPYQPPKFGR